MPGSPHFLQHDVDTAVSFHGSVCTPLVIGVHAARMGLELLGPTEPGDLLVVIDTDGCAVDGLQAVAGCTIGNGALVVRAQGLDAFTFLSRERSTGFRLTLDPFYDPAFSALRATVRTTGASDEELERLEEMAATAPDRVLATDPNELFEVTPALLADFPQPRRSRELWTSCGDCWRDVRVDSTLDAGTGIRCANCSLR